VIVRLRLDRLDQVILHPGNTIRDTVRVAVERELSID
jgi:hypothetical protein